MPIVRVYRNVSPPSAEELESLYRLPRAFPDHSVVMEYLPRLALSLTEDSELREAVKTNESLRHLAQPALMKVISRSLPPGANQNLTLPVREAGFRRDSMGRHFVLTLDDPQDRFEEQRAAIRDRIAPDWDWSDSPPQLTIAHIRPKRSTYLIEAWAADRVPGSISFHAMRTALASTKPPSKQRRR